MVNEVNTCIQEISEESLGMQQLEKTEHVGCAPLVRQSVVVGLLPCDVVQNTPCSSIVDCMACMVEDSDVGWMQVGGAKARWMMGCSDDSGFSTSDSFQSRKFRPLISRPTSTDPFAFNHHPASVTEHSKRDFNTQPAIVSSRWDPTPEQLKTLGDLYRRGTRTPTAEQIQHITSQLRRYGKIEGKNVFYWFQNHKARERQKRRRRLESSPDEQQGDIKSLERKESGSSKTDFEVEQTKNWVPPLNCSTLAEESFSIRRAARAAVAECRTDGWIPSEEEQLQQRRSSAERHATWQMMQLSCSPIHLINTSMTTTKAGALEATDPKHINTHNLNMFTRPQREDLIHFARMGTGCNYDEEECGESQTLQLFPLRSDDSNGTDFTEKETEFPRTMTTSNFSPYQFFEFLPLKN
ncbi:hypothetical protein HHK36_014859 [Tetracentron sinense]|uniref:Homeobox domain-containing protein n=1 Tax=Tetracentron sinense TaxID=13715 RepID=A0A834YZR3_TETSI|nr:hypothetical protein HHK36_014859 [Tetracentron sinense]